jgi:hypothetical protein
MLGKLRRSGALRNVENSSGYAILTGNSENLIFIHSLCAISDSSGLSIPREWMFPGKKAVLLISFSFLMIASLNASQFERDKSTLNVLV